MSHRPAKRAPAKAPDPAQAATDETRWQLDITASTPIFKGGADPDRVDEGRPLRATSVRGNLRVWWRATSQISDVAELHAAEEALFGGVHGTSNKPVASRVRVSCTAQTSRAASVSALGGKMGYATKLVIDGNSTDKKLFHDDASGRIAISAPRGASEDLRRAIHAWLLLGGIGGRTRRGLGQLQTSHSDFPTAFPNPHAWWQTVQGLAKPTRAAPWPQVQGARALFFDHSTSSAVAASDLALKAFQKVRGMRSLGGKNFSGDTRAKEIQQDWLTIRSGRGKLHGYAMSFGMPLVYDSANGHLPGKVTFEPSTSSFNRFPSPVLIRAIHTEGGWYPAIVMLPIWVRPTFEAKKQRGLQGQVDPRALDVLARELTTADWKEFS